MQKAPPMFHDMHQHGFARLAVCVPAVRVADPDANAVATIEMARAAHARDAALALFPELGLSAYSNDDLFFQDALLERVRARLDDIVEASRDLMPVLLVGAPLATGGRLYNCAVAIHRGRVLGVVPKAYLPNYREFYEKRHFAPGLGVVGRTITIGGGEVPFGTDLVFSARDLPDFHLGVEICEDVWTPNPPSTLTALAGATVLANLSASNITIGKAEARRLLCRAQSARCVAAYLYSAAGPGESTTDLAWDGHAAIFENGETLAEAERFAPAGSLITADVDLERLRQERMRLSSWGDAQDAERARVGAMRRVAFDLEPPRDRPVRLEREIPRFPFVPADPAARDRDCHEAFNIQVMGLVTRLRATGLKRVVLGVSGGLDSTHALIVAARALDRLGLPRENLHCVTLPGFATSDHTKTNAWALMTAFGVHAEEIPIGAASLQMLRDIGHPAADGGGPYDVTYENVQAGARTSLLFRLANKRDAMVLGTGDLSELALGWCTYGVGDHMSHYNVNGSVPKTLIQHLIRWVAERREFGADASRVLLSILATEISPELVPGDGAKPAQRTEDVVGPYALQDFNLYWITRYGFRPSKVAFMALQAWGDAARGDWPAGMSPADMRAHDLATIRKWLRVFLWRFFAISQFKRSAVPNGPKVASGGSLSPRGDWRAPSDSSAAPWLAELDENVPEA
jgi:NAD+ synthase (glutamine-hydrolysing)